MLDGSSFARHPHHHLMIEETVETVENAQGKRAKVCEESFDACGDRAVMRARVKRSNEGFQSGLGNCGVTCDSWKCLAGDKC